MKKKCQVANRTALWLQQIVDNIDTGIITVNSDNIVILCNPFANKFLNLGNQIIGENIENLFDKYDLLRIICVGNQLSEEIFNFNNLTIHINRKKIYLNNNLTGNLYSFNIWNLSTKFNNYVYNIDSIKYPNINNKNNPESNITLGQLRLMQECNIVAKSEKIISILDLCYKIAQFDTPVLILGESGVGKESIARFIHRASKRYNKGKFIAVNCGTFSKDLVVSELFGYENGAFTGAKKEGKPGLFEMADQGTLFLDEIAELPLDFQVKFLRVLQEQKYMRLGGTKNINVNVRILAATNRDIEQMVDKGEFRKDLFYRLNVLTVRVPALRERKEDIPELINHFLKLYNSKYQMIKLFSDEILDLLKNYDWPGNVRELSNLVERLVLTTSEHVILPRHLPDTHIRCWGKAAPPDDDIPPLQQAIEDVEKDLIIRAINMYGSTYKAAKVLGVSQSTVARKSKKYCSEITLRDD